VNEWPASGAALCCGRPFSRYLKLQLMEFGLVYT
jgi:hypothetical protein